MKKYTWHIVLFVVAIATLWMGGKSLYQFWGYMSLSHSTKATTTEWRAMKVDESKYFLEATYTFKVKGALQRRVEVLKKPVYLNSYGAQDGINEAKERTWTVWYNPSNPSQCTLMRELPWKGALYALMSLLIFFYFLWRFLTRDQMTI